MRVVNGCCSTRCLLLVNAIVAQLWPRPVTQSIETSQRCLCANSDKSKAYKVVPRQDDKKSRRPVFIDEMSGM